MPGQIIKMIYAYTVLIDETRVRIALWLCVLLPLPYKQLHSYYCILATTIENQMITCTDPC
jgi:hypothetical protein